MKIFKFENFISVKNLTAELIPHKDFHKGIWLKGEKWYYFSPKERDFKIPTTIDFHKTLDKDIIPIIDFLYSKGIATTPSCSGHFYNIENYKNIYQSLEKECLLIKNEGISLIDPETNKDYFFKDKNYELPWTLDEFINKVMNYQHKGVIGFIDENNQLFDKLKLITEIETFKDGELTILIVSPNNKIERQKIWNKILNYLKF